jgi:hypothetical protein
VLDGPDMCCHKASNFLDTRPRLFGEHSVVESFFLVVGFLLMGWLFPES